MACRQDQQQAKAQLIFFQFDKRRSLKKTRKHTKRANTKKKTMESQKLVIDYADASVEKAREIVNKLKRCSDCVEVVATHGCVSLAIALAFDLKEVFKLAIGYGNLDFFKGYTPCKIIKEIAIETNNVLFARWCFLSDSLNFNEVEPDETTPEFALFMLQIIKQTDKRYYHFMKSALSDNIIAKNMHFYDDFRVPMANDKIITSAMLWLKIFKDEKKFEILMKNTKDVNLVKFGILCGCEYSINWLMNMYNETQDPAIELYILNMNLKFENFLKTQFLFKKRKKNQS